jgi:hypothetical protein
MIYRNQAPWLPPFARGGLSFLFLDLGNSPTSCSEIPLEVFNIQRQDPDMHTAYLSPTRHLNILDRNGVSTVSDWRSTRNLLTLIFFPP